MTSRLLRALTQGPLILDAALGTRLAARGLDLRKDDPALWNLTHPEEVLELHRRDASAGAQVLVANTFGANRSWLSRYGHAEQVEAIDRRAVALARQAAGRSRFVLGDIGPTAAVPAGTAAEQAEFLADAGVDGLLLETFRAETAEGVLVEVRAAVGRVLPVLVSLWQWPDPPDRAACRLIERGATVLGTNCRPGMDAAILLCRRLERVVSCPLLVKPSASVSGPPEPSSKPAAFAAAVPYLLESNVRLIGGCCGTTEAHIAALAAACPPHPIALPIGSTGALK